MALSGDTKNSPSLCLGAYSRGTVPHMAQPTKHIADPCEAPELRPSRRCSTVQYLIQPHVTIHHQVRTCVRPNITTILPT